jgi:hypothetical protein
MAKVWIVIGVAMLIFAFSGKAQIPTAQEARKLSYESRVNDSLLTIKMKWIHVNSAIEIAIDNGVDSAMVWNMNSVISNELLKKGYKIKYKDYIFKRWVIYW